ncbi:ADP-ribosylglycohydrolase family protein [Nocardia sp. NPDC004654]|uniref:ADP-ribosylglycohydrolase family protein n=1 Tax=Nocardia sp. NPDC004654 TaxID=3154776 RepID=UPI0033A595B5
MDRTIEAVFYGRHEADPRALLYFEWRERLESGYPVAGFESAVRALAGAETVDADGCWGLLGEIESAGRDPEWGYDEGESGIAPSDDRVPHGSASAAAGSGRSFAPDELLDRVYGGWLGRCVGCALGKPLENGFVWTREHIRSYLERAGAYPLTDYVPALLPPSPRFPLNPTWPVSARGRIDGAPRDDDIDYTVLGLHLLESRGLNFTADDVAKLWLERLPFLQTYTAERVAYRNLVDGLRPPRTAEVRNPYREWIGAMIRADIFGYVSPGDPERAAALAAREAAVSHTGNGIFAAMWAAALVAAACTAEGAGIPSGNAAAAAVGGCVPRLAGERPGGGDAAVQSPVDAPYFAEGSGDVSDVRARVSVPGASSAVTAALIAAQNVLPPRSRLAIALGEVRADYERGLSWEQAVDDIDARHGGYNWVHAIPNACRVAAGLLWGKGDFTRTIALTVQSGADTDSNGATAGSVAGILAGAKGIPGYWIEPLHDVLHSAVMGYDGVRISDLARRTCALV